MNFENKDTRNYQCISDDVVLGDNVSISKFVNLYGCSIGSNTKIGSFVEIQKAVKIGSLCKISSHSFICSGVTIGKGCFIGHGVVFINDKHPRSVSDSGQLEKEKDWEGRYCLTEVEEGVSIGSGSTILGGITIGKNAVIGAGSVVTKNVPSHEVWVGNPARFQKKNQ